MNNVNKNIRKVCSFYASDWHLITMLLPHVNKAINEENKIITILEEDAQDKVEMLLGKLRITNKKEILEIGWNGKLFNQEEFERIIKESIINNEKTEVITAGSNEYIEKVNNIIENYASQEEAKQKDIKVINCYYVENISNIKEILNNHDAVLNTAGEKGAKEYLMQISI